MNRWSRKICPLPILATMLASLASNAAEVSPTKEMETPPPSHITQPVGFHSWLEENKIKVAIFIDEKGQAIVTHFDELEFLAVPKCDKDSTDPKCRLEDTGGTNINSYAMLLKVYEPPARAATPSPTTPPDPPQSKTRA